MKRIILISLLILIVRLAFSQKQELITDRPDQTEAPTLVPQGGVQIETGFQYEKERSQGVTVKNFTYNTTLIKYGVNEHFELRFISEYLGTQVKGAGESQVLTAKGFSPLAVGVKIKLADEKGIWPRAALIGHVNLRTGSKAYAPSYTAADFRFTFANTLSERLTLSYNMGVEWDGETPEAAFLYTLSLGYSVSDRIGVFIESYSFFPEKTKADNRIDAGLTYLITDVIQWDASAGLGLSDNAPDSFVSTGLSVRLFK